MEPSYITQHPTRTFAIISSGDPAGYEQASVSTASSLPTIPSNANKALVQPETGDIRWRDDGTAPTTSTGNYLPAMSTLTIEALKSLANFQMIAVTGTVTVNVNYYAK